MSIAESMHDANTEAFIRENPSAIRITRRKKVATTAGGFTWEQDGDPIIPQVGRLVFSANKGDNIQRTLPDGQIVDVTATLVMMNDADVEVGDLFQYDGDDWLVAQKSTVPTWRISCEVGHA